MWRNERIMHGHTSQCRVNFFFDESTHIWSWRIQLTRIRFGQLYTKFGTLLELHLLKLTIRFQQLK